MEWLWGTAKASPTFYANVSAGFGRRDQRTLQAKSGSLGWDVDHLRVATAAAGVALWSWNVDTGEILMDERACELWDVPQGEVITFGLLSERIHPEDLEKVGSVLTGTRSQVGSYEIDFRIQSHGEFKWISARGRGADEGIVEGVMFGIFMDVTERKQAEEARELVAGEMSHRVKNLFAVTSALTRISARSTSSTAEMASDLLERMTALGSAHDLVRSVPGEEQQPLRLSKLLRVLLAPYDERHGGGSQIKVKGSDIRVGEAGVNALALVTHELATNSIKYGALSVSHGSLDISYEPVGSDLVVVWREHGSPALPASARREGFGTKLIARCLGGQLAGSVMFEWPEPGLVATMRMRMSHIAP